MCCRTVVRLEVNDVRTCFELPCFCAGYAEHVRTVHTGAYRKYSHEPFNFPRPKSPGIFALPAVYLYCRSRLPVRHVQQYQVRVVVLYRVRKAET